MIFITYYLEGRETGLFYMHYQALSPITTTKVKRIDYKSMITNQCHSRGKILAPHSRANKD